MGVLDGKVAIVTGAGQGVGEGVALALAGAGASVAAAGRTVSKVERTAATINERGGRAIAIECDVVDPDQVSACVDRTVTEFGTVDILVNNAQVPATRTARRDPRRALRHRLEDRSVGDVPLHARLLPVPEGWRRRRQHGLGFGDPARPHRVRRLRRMQGSHPDDEPGRGV